MAKQTRHAPTAVAVERTLESTGNTVRLLLEPLARERVRILEYHRMRRGETRYSRQRTQEGVIVAFDRLKLERSFGEVFQQGSLFDAAD